MIFNPTVLLLPSAVELLLEVKTLLPAAAILFVDFFIFFLK
jgi:hypothetical protein